MRPINLIPEEERRRSSRERSSSGNPLAYLIVGALAIGLIGVVMLVLISNTISDRETEVTALQAERAVATAEAEKLAPYASFQAVAEQRTSTIADLANSRFDWVRVIKQLALTLPSNVYFNSLTGSAGGGEGGSEGISGPSLTIAGCAPDQDAVAGFVATLKEIDGVTRVELKQSAVSQSGGEGGATGASSCSVGRKAQFQIIVAFDEAPPSPDSSAGLAEAAEAESSTESTEPGSTGTEGSNESSEPESSGSESESGGESAPESTSASTAGTSVGAG
jgi:Tfp pilus assembly protein PilN